MAKVFISFIHEEEEYAEAVQTFIARILGAEAKPFLSSDQRQIYAGEKWLDRIMEELQGATVILLMLSEESVKRPWVNFEAGAAWMKKDTVTIPVCFGDLHIGDLPKPYSSLQAVDLSDEQNHEYLATSVAHHLGLPKPVGRFLGILGALGGDERRQQIEWEYSAYEGLRNKLERANICRIARKEAE
jgi:TIR domain